MIIEYTTEQPKENQERPLPCHPGKSGYTATCLSISRDGSFAIFFLSVAIQHLLPSIHVVLVTVSRRLKDEDI